MHIYVLHTAWFKAKSIFSLFLNYFRHLKMQFDEITTSSKSLVYLTIPSKLIGSLYHWMPKLKPNNKRTQASKTNKSFFVLFHPKIS